MLSRYAKLHFKHVGLDFPEQYVHNTNISPFKSPSNGLILSRGANIQTGQTAIPSATAQI
jgi:hypothetical protein